MARTGASEAKITRRQQALDLRLSGHRYRAIGKELGISHVQAYRDVSEALGEITKLNIEKAERLRDVELQRLETATLALWPKVREGNEQAIRTLVSIMDRRAKLLGLDAPTKLGVSDGDGGPVTVIHRHINA